MQSHLCGELTLPLCWAHRSPCCVVSFFFLDLRVGGGGYNIPLFSPFSIPLFSPIQAVDGIGEALVAVDVRAVWQP